MKLGIGTYSHMWSIGFEGAQPEEPMTAMGLLEEARKLEVKLVQVGPNLPLDQLPVAELDTFDQKAREWGIELELATRGLETDHLTAQVELSERLGSSLVRTMPELGGQSPDPAKIAPHLRAILPLLQEKGIRLGLENGNIPAVELRRILEEIDSPQLGIVLDTVNSLAISEGLKHVAEVLAPFTVCLHMKEFVVERAWSMMGFTVEGRPAGQGQVDIPWLMETVKVSRFPFNVVLEAWPPEQESLQQTIELEHVWAVESVRHMRQYVAD